MLPPLGRGSGHRRRAPRAIGPADAGADAGSPDQAVQDTNEDAQTSKLSAVSLGYVRDDYVRFFVRQPVRRPPLINRGYYARDHVISQLLRAFLAAAGASGRAAQVLCLGAGFDTRYFQLRASGALDPGDVRWFEVDFAAVTRPKLRVVREQPALAALLGADAVFDDDGADLASRAFSVLSGDLRQFADVERKLVQHGFDASLPTFVLSECVLIYLEQAHADAIVRWAGTALAASMFACYEQIRPHDAFGETMIRNLEGRGIVLHSLHAYPDVPAQAQRYRAAGFTHVVARDMLELYDHYIAPTEHARVARLEFLDEIEEWQLIMRHYCCVWASRNLPELDLPRATTPPVD